MKHVLALSIGAALLAAAPALAQPPAPQFVRGTVTAVTPTSLNLTSREGKKLTIGLTKDWTVQITKPVTAAQIVPGSFIGTAEMPQKDGTGRSLEVHVFPPGVKLGEGHYGWDLKKGSMMTNGTVGKVVASKSGSAFDVSYSTGVRKIVVPAKTPIVQIVPGARTLITPGSKVFMAAIQTSGGLVTNSVAVGENGKAPPM
ncbi:MAG: hypothetical protein KA220_07065 [Phenylobacterium sp.]|nr:hypothetical protein [Phenylobacterium sp.]MBP8246221.1 hypothetical protein [Phenylobacterium sp.]